MPHRFPLEKFEVQGQAIRADGQPHGADACTYNLSS
jgi:hypothetical protein